MMHHFNSHKRKLASIESNGRRSPELEYADVSPRISPGSIESDSMFSSNDSAIEFDFCREYQPARVHSPFDYIGGFDGTNSSSHLDLYSDSRLGSPFDPAQRFDNPVMDSDHEPAEVYLTTTNDDLEYFSYSNSSYLLPA